MLQNFRVIMKYNPAEAYALAIGHFADRLRGGPPFVQPWPRQERVLSRAERLELQQLLAQRGFYRGTPDGQFGGQTREALRSFQASIGAPADDSPPPTCWSGCGAAQADQALLPAIALRPPEHRHSLSHDCMDWLTHIVVEDGYYAASVAPL